MDCLTTLNIPLCFDNLLFFFLLIFIQLRPFQHLSCLDRNTHQITSLNTLDYPATATVPFFKRPEYTQCSKQLPEMAEPLVKVFIFKSSLLSCNLYKIKCTTLNVFFSEIWQIDTVCNHQHNKDIEHFCHPWKIPLFSLNSLFPGPKH